MGILGHDYIFCRVSVRPPKIVTRDLAGFLLKEILHRGLVTCYLLCDSCCPYRILHTYSDQACHPAYIHRRVFGMRRTDRRFHLDIGTYTDRTGKMCFIHTKQNQQTTTWLSIGNHWAISLAMLTTPSIVTRLHPEESGHCSKSICFPLDDMEQASHSSSMRRSACTKPS